MPAVGVWESIGPCSLRPNALDGAIKPCLRGRPNRPWLQPISAARGPKSTPARCSRLVERTQSGGPANPRGPATTGVQSSRVPVVHLTVTPVSRVSLSLLRVGRPRREARSPPFFIEPCHHGRDRFLSDASVEGTGKVHSSPGGLKPGVSTGGAGARSAVRKPRMSIKSSPITNSGRRKPRAPSLLMRDGDPAALVRRLPRRGPIGGPYGRAGAASVRE